MKELIKKITKKNKWRLIVFFVAIILNTYLLILPARIIGNIIDLLGNIDANRVLIINNIVMLLGLSVLLMGIRLVWKYYETYLIRIYEKEIKDKVFKHVMEIKLEELQNRKNGEIMSYFVKDINEIRIMIRHIIAFGTRILFTCIFGVYAMATKVDLKLTIIAIIPLIVAAFLTFKIKELIIKHFRKSQEHFTQLSEYLQESTEAIRTTKSYGQEDSQIKHFETLNKAVRKSNIKVDAYSTLLSTCVSICFGLSYGLAIIFGSKLIISGTITIGAFVTFNSYIALFVNPVTWVPNFVSRLKRGTISFKRLDSVLEIPIEPEQKRLPLEEVKKIGFSGDILIKDLSFRYPEYIDTVLKNINVEIKQGETIGIIGKIGSGKSTLMDLLVKLYNVKRGKIFVNNVDINDIPISVLRNKICYITQENFLFSTTLKENITLFRDGYLKEEVEDSLKQSLIYKEVEEMQDGIYTLVGERGGDLSGGQKQRIVISRAFLDNADIIIFDDTFSALDNRTQQKLLKNIKTLVEGKTCIIISNRISDIKHSDRILVMEDGEIIESGIHKELIAKKGNYYEFYKEQAIKKSESILS
ncbi:MAG: ABC transporter ATP-binding protein [Clostridia bacterium]